MIPPVDQSLPPLPFPEQTPQSNNVSFDAPQNWGGASSSISTPTSNMVTPLSAQPILPPAQEPKTSFLKVFLISISLILLGVLLGVLAAKFFQPAPNTNSIVPQEEVVENITDQITQSVEPTIIATPTATSESLLKLTWKSYLTSKYKLFYPQTWNKKTSSVGTTLTKGNITFLISNEKSDYPCDQKSLRLYNKDLVSWDLQESSASSQYQLCESTENGLSANTSIGSLVLTGSKIDKQSLDEFFYIVEKLELLPQVSKKISDSESL